MKLLFIVLIIAVTFFDGSFSLQQQNLFGGARRFGKTEHEVEQLSEPIRAKRTIDFGTPSYGSSGYGYNSFATNGGGYSNYGNGGGYYGENLNYFPYGTRTYIIQRIQVRRNQYGEALGYPIY